MCQSCIESATALSDYIIAFFIFRNVFFLNITIMIANTSLYLHRSKYKSNIIS